MPARILATADPRWVCLGLVLTGCILTGCAARHASPHTPSSSSDPASVTALDTPPQPREEPPARKSALLPAIEIVGMDVLINLGSRVVTQDAALYQVTPATIRRNLRRAWVVEDDPFEVNQFLHPYQGAMYHNIARSTGHGYWTSVAYTFAGSALWEIAGETTAPSKNDQIASGIAGSFLGEPLFRVSRMLLDRNGGKSGFWRVLGATMISPPAGINRAMFGDRFGPPAPDVLAASDIRIQLGVAAALTGDPRIPDLEWNEQLLGFSVDHGFPGDPKYRHARPFDYFRIDGLASSNRLASLTSRGLVAGKDFNAGRSQGVWGLYGNYDYFAPDIFRLSSTALAFGATIQAWLSNSLALHGTALLGVGYTAAQDAGADSDGDYHYGVAPYSLVNLRLIAGRRAALDLTGREYYISDVASFGTRRRDVILVGDASLALRVYRQHAVAIKYVLFRRNATHPELADLTQSRSTIGLFYTFLGSSGFGTIR
jgi:hypothetical protein